MFADGNGLSAVGYLNPDNTDSSSNSLMVHDGRSNARIWRYDYDTGVCRVVDCLPKEGRDPGVYGCFEMDWEWPLDALCAGLRQL